VISTKFHEQSDIDLLVDFDRTGYHGAFLQFMGLKEELEALFDRPVDLLVNRPFRNPYFKETVEATKQVVYHAA